MNELTDFLQKQFPGGYEIYGPQFERTEKLGFEWMPENDEEFYKVIKHAPIQMLHAFGFRKWSTVNEEVGKNQQTPEVDIMHIPIINGEPGETMPFDCGRGTAPIEKIGKDEHIILFPGEWYDVIPDGFIVTGLSAQKEPFKKGVSDDDIRFGCLAYGITRPVE